MIATTVPAPTYCQAMDLRGRLLAKLDTSDPDACWPWGGHTDPQGYGRLRLGGRDLPVGYAHRIAYQLLVGPIPPGLHIDHGCHNTDPDCPGGPDCPHRACCNPRHLEAVTCAVNMGRGKAPTALLHRAGRCKRGHPATAARRRKTTGHVAYCIACRHVRRATA